MLIKLNVMIRLRLTNCHCLISFERVPVTSRFFPHFVEGYFFEVVGVLDYVVFQGIWRLFILPLKFSVGL